MKIKLQESDTANKLLCRCGEGLFFIFEEGEEGGDGIISNIECAACHKMYTLEIGGTSES